MNRRRILMLTTQLGYGGAETSFIRLANFLAQSAEVTVALFTADYGTGAYAKGHEPLQAKIVLLDSEKPMGRLRRWWRRIRALRALKAQHEATISFLSGPNLVNVLAGFSARSVVSLRGSRHFDPVSPRLQRWIFRHLIDPLVFRLAARIVPVSPGLMVEIRTAAGAKALKKTAAISPFIDSATLAQRCAEPPPEIYAALKGQLVIVAVGRLSIEKGFHHLIRVFAEVARVQPGAKLLLVGDGPMLPDLQQLCIDLQLPMNEYAPGVSAVLFAGYQKNALPLMALARVYAMTSATEGFPNVVLEAMGAGVPVIAADTPWGARAILCDDQTPPDHPYPTTCITPTEYGTLMPRIDARQYQSAWAEALHAALNHRDEARIIRARMRVGQYDMAVVGAQWNRLLEGMEAA